jgi:thioredoxin reductase/ferredoxin
MEGETNVSGIWLAGDLRGIPLLKYAIDSGSKVVDSIQKYLSKTQGEKGSEDHSENLDLLIIGAGVAGIAAGHRAAELGLRFQILSGDRSFSTIRDFPAQKPIFLYPKDFSPESNLVLRATVKEDLVDELEKFQEELETKQGAPVIRQAKVFSLEKRSGWISALDEEGKQILVAKTVLVCIGKSGDYRKLGIPGEDSPIVFHRLHDPADYSGKKIVVAGGGDSALEAAIALSESGASVHLVHRGSDFPKAKSENQDRISELETQGKLKISRNSKLVEIQNNLVRVETDSGISKAIQTDLVFSLIGRTPPYDFFRRSGLKIERDWNLPKIASLVGFLVFCVWMYHWKMDGSYISEFFRSRGWFPFSLESLRASFHPGEGFVWILFTNLVSPSFYYSIAYTGLVGIFGFRRVRKRPTPYIKRQTLTLFLIQFFPLFLIPFFILPILGVYGAYESGIGQWIADEFFPKVDYGLGREYWRSFGLILAWPLFIWNVFSGSPMWGWLTLSLVQTFVIIPLIVWRWGKGAYCGWICSCGALAETLGDDHRKKMPHGPIWNRVNILGQVILLAAFLLLIARLLSWFFPNSIGGVFQTFFSGFLYGWFPFTYYYFVDVWLAGILGVGLYFHFSGRTWCRFACPLAALMHIYARFSRFRIFAEKKKCISCNICTSVCHQGIDVMSFANKGLPMEDPQCVRCSACVVNCPTQVLHFGRLDSQGNPVYDQTRAVLN